MDIEHLGPNPLNYIWGALFSTFEVLCLIVAGATILYAIRGMFPDRWPDLIHPPSKHGLGILMIFLVAWFLQSWLMLWGSRNYTP